MTEDEILEELRTIRTLLAIDKEDDLKQLTEDLSDLQVYILNELGYTEWRPLSSTELAEAFDCGTTKVSEHRTDLAERNFIEKTGSGKGATYRKTGLVRAAQQLGVLE